MKQYSIFSKEIDRLGEDGRLKRQKLADLQKLLQVEHVRKLGIRHALILFLMFAVLGTLLFFVPNAYIAPLCLAAFVADIMLIYGFCKKMVGCVKGNFQSGKEIYESSIDEMIEIIKRERKRDVVKDGYLEELSSDIEIPIKAILNIDGKILKETTEENIMELAARLKGGMDIMRIYIKDLCVASKEGVAGLSIQPVPYDLGIMICDIENIALRMADEKGIRLLIEVNNEMPTILEGDNLHIELIIIKLISNALKYTDEGQVSLNINCVGMSGDETMLSVSVKDSGCGINEENLEKYFSKDRPAADAIADGCSVGMAMVRMLLEKMGSELRVESKLSVGSEFRFLVKQKVIDVSPLGKREDAIRRYKEADSANRAALHSAETSTTTAAELTLHTKAAEIEETQTGHTQELKPVETAPATSADKPSSGDEFIDRINTISLISIAEGITNSGSMELYKKVICDFCDSGSAKADEIEMHYEKEDLRNYTVEVHALKSAARIIGAMKLSKLAEALEEAGNAGDMVRIKNATGELLRLYRELIAEIDARRDDSADKPPIDEDSCKDALKSLKEFAEVFDFDSVDYVMNELKKYTLPEPYKDIYGKLKTLVAEVSRDDILNLLENI